MTTYHALFLDFHILFYILGTYFYIYSPYPMRKTIVTITVIALILSIVGTAMIAVFSGTTIDPIGIDVAGSSISTGTVSTGTMGTGSSI
jgi:hypothetical protein